MHTHSHLQPPRLAALYDGLPLPEGDYLSAVPVPGVTTHRVARNRDDHASLLITVTRDDRPRPAPVELQNLAVAHDVTCRVTDPRGATESAQFTVITCTSTDPLLKHHFLQVASPALLLLGSQPTREDVAHTIDGLVRLFRAVSTPSRVSGQALWAELFVIADSSDPRAMVRAWRVEPEERFDFSAGSQRVEVKASAGGLRQHHFSLEQLRPADGVDALVASVFVERMGAGTSVGELVDEVRSHVSDDMEALLHFEQTVLSTLGLNAQEALTERFDMQRAKQALQFYDATEIPSVSRDVPDGVSQVRFVSDLEGVHPIDRISYRAKGGLFEAGLSQ